MCLLEADDVNVVSACGPTLAKAAQLVDNLFAVCKKMVYAECVDLPSWKSWLKYQLHRQMQLINYPFAISKKRQST